MGVYLPTPSTTAWPAKIQTTHNAASCIRMLKRLLKLDADANKASCIKMQMHSCSLHRASKIPKDATVTHCTISRCEQ
eukprot:3305609-Prymnesium_polylepis.1